MKTTTETNPLAKALVVGIVLTLMIVVGIILL
jgi:hypothetical protein